MGNLYGEVRVIKGLVRPVKPVTVILGQPQELRHLPFGLGTWEDLWLFLHLWIHLPAPLVVPQILYLPLFNRILL